MGLQVGFVVAVLGIGQSVKERQQVRLHVLRQGIRCRVAYCAV
jgi:hypothetical protein